MKVFERIAELNNGQMQIFTEKCPATIEHKYNILGEKRMNKFCKLGCSVKCTEEYLNLRAKL